MRAPVAATLKTTAAPENEKLSIRPQDISAARLETTTHDPLSSKHQGYYCFSTSFISCCSTAMPF